MQFGVGDERGLIEDKTCQQGLQKCHMSDYNFLDVQVYIWKCITHALHRYPLIIGIPISHF